MLHLTNATYAWSQPPCAMLLVTTFLNAMLMVSHCPMYHDSGCKDEMRKALDVMAICRV